jgi:uncharacterized integral membrane protein
MRFLKVILSTIIVLLGFVFIIENLEVLKHLVKLKLDLYFTTLESPDVYLWVIILFSFFLGAFTASLYGIYDIIVQRQSIRQLKHNMEIMSRELKLASTAPAPSPRPAEPEAPSQPE